MMLTKITLENFGIFRGEHSIDLKVEPGKPIVLVGALNGSGKTTLLDAVRLALYGKNAPLSNKGKIGYTSYLKRCRNKSTSAIERTVIEIELLTQNDTLLRINRQWGNDVESDGDAFFVYTDGRPNHNLTQNWEDSVHEYFPLQLSELFQFDGEKIEFFAEPRNTASLIENGLNTLLGLGVVDKAITDLKAVKKRKVKQDQSTDYSQAYISKSDEVEALQQALEKNNELVRELEGQIDLVNTDLNSLNREYESRGGAAYDRRKTIESDLRDVTSNIERVQQEFRGLLASAVPLSLLKENLESVLSRNKRSAKTVAVRQLRSELKEIADSLPSEVGAKAELEQLLSIASGDDLLGFAISHADHAMTDVENELKVLEDLHKELLDLNVRSRNLEADRLTIPDPDHIIDLVEQRENLKMRSVQMKTEQAELIDNEKSLKYKLNQAESDLSKVSALLTKHELQEIKSNLVLARIDRASEALDRFKSRATAGYVAKLEAAVVDSLARLFRKDGFVENATIDPNTFNLQLFEPDGHALKIDRLSAGERQLVAISIVWALISCSNKLLPAIIDTPLGRLDGTHRKHLVTNYFPVASRQVILLSTDEEITQPYYELIRNYISQEYELAFDDEQGTSLFRTGYPFIGKEVAA